MKEPANPGKESPMPEMPKDRFKQVMQQTTGVLKKLGQGASGLVARIRKTQSVEEMQETISEYRAANASESNQVAERLEKLHGDIAARKQAFAAAPAARKRVLEMELKNLLSQYKATERTYGILLENERTLNLVLDRLQELNAYSLGGISEDLISKIADDVEDKSLEADLKADAVSELERAGRRRDTGLDSEDLWEELDGFGEAESAVPERSEEQGESSSTESLSRDPEGNRKDKPLMDQE